MLEYILIHGWHFQVCKNEKALEESPLHYKVCPSFCHQLYFREIHPHHGIQKG